MTPPLSDPAPSATAMPARWSPLAVAVFWAALAFAVVMALLPHPPAVPGAPTDKIQHMLAFVTMTVFACAAYPRAPLLRVGERLSFLGAMIELLQSIPALHRDCDIRDWVADTAAILAVLLLVAVVRRRRQGG